MPRTWSVRILNFYRVTKQLFFCTFSEKKNAAFFRRLTYKNFGISFVHSSVVIYQKILRKTIDRIKKKKKKAKTLSEHRRIEIRKKFEYKFFGSMIWSIRNHSRALKLSMPVKVVAWIFLGPATAPAARGEFSLFHSLFCSIYTKSIRKEERYSLSFNDDTGETCFLATVLLPEWKSPSQIFFAAAFRGPVLRSSYTTS